MRWPFALLAGWLAGCVANPPGMSIPASTLKPEGDGPFPAIVVLHDCSGLGPRSGGSPGRWAQLLLQKGYVVILPDSFATRGFPDGVCTDLSPERQKVGARQRAIDAHEALAYARTLPYVDGKRIGVMGGSHGGSSTLAAMVRPGFKAAVALYPGCGGRPYRPAGPVLILSGELDDWTPAKPCQRLAEASRAAGYDVSIKVYPGAHHAFDSNAPVRYVASRANGNAPNKRGATTGGNPAAWADSIREVTGFFGRNL